MYRNNNKMTKPDSQGTSISTEQLLDKNSQLQGLGFEIFGEQEFVRYPVMGVNQPTSDFKPEGKFHNRVTGEVYDSIDIVFLALRRSMSYRPHGYSDPVPTCYSSGGLRPDATVEQPVHHTCHRMGPRGLIAECPHAQWTRNSEGKARRACDLRYTAATHFNGEHYLMYFQGRSIAPLEKFLSQLRQFRQPLFGVKATLKLTYRTKKEGFMGNFYEVNFPDFSDQSDADRIQIIDALSLQEEALFFKEYFETAPSDLYHDDNTETNSNENVPLNEGVRYVDERPNNHPQNERWGQSEQDF